MSVARRVTSVFTAGLIMGVLAGLALGVIWARLAPRVPLVIGPDASRPQGFQPQEYLADDLTFAALSIVAGIAIAVGLARMRREHLTSVLGAALLAGFIGSGLMWFIGEHLGAVDIEGLSATVTTETVVDAPLRLSMPAVALVWPIASALVITVLAGFDAWRELRSPVER